MRVAGGTREEWRALMLAETWMFADEAVEMGLAGRVEEVERRRPAGDAEERMARKHDLRRFGYRFESRSAAPRPQRRTTTSYGDRFARGGLIEEARASVALDGDTIDVGPVTVGRGQVRDDYRHRLDELNEQPEQRSATQDQPKGRSIAYVEALLNLDD
jgi:hypothetical protein